MQRRILHVARFIHRGGIASWLKNILHHIDRSRYRMDFLILSDVPRADSDELAQLGSFVRSCRDYRYPWRLARDMREMMRERGPYDVVHSHVNYYDGFVLMLASRHGVPVRIAHSHSDHRLKEPARPWLHRVRRRPYIGLGTRWIGRYATAGLAVNAGAAEALFGRRWRADARFRVLPLGVDTNLFSEAYDRRQVRASLGIPADALVVGHVGNYVWPKNHEFALAIMQQIRATEQRAWLVLVGHGLLGSDLEEQVQALGLAEQIVIAGPRGDVPRLMLGAMDVFLFPSRVEGLGLVLIEAQAAGLPCVLTDSLPREVDLVPQLLHRLPLGASATAWASVTLDLARRMRPLDQRTALAQVEASNFNINNSVRQLTRVYDRAKPS